MISSKLCIILVIFLEILTGGSAGPGEKALLDHLLTNYNVLERPVTNESETLTVSFGLTLLSILEMNVAHGYLEANIWLTLEWNDKNMRWNRSDFRNINNIRIPPHRLWTPDIHLYNSIHPLFDPTYQTKVVVRHDGNMTYIPPGIFKSSCVTDVMHYPYDEQKCQLKFGSWTMDSGMIDLQLNSEQGGEISSFVPNGEWELMGVPGHRNAIYYACCPDAYVDITYTINLRRRGEGILYGCTLALLFGALAMICSLLLPSNSGQRIALGVVTFLAIFIAGITIHNSLGGKSSLMAMYFFRLALLIFASILSNIIIIHFYGRNPMIHRMPVWLRKAVFDIIPPFILLSRPSSTKAVSTADNRIGQVIGIDGQSQYEDQISDLQAMALKVGGKHVGSSALNDWQYFSTVLDRLAFIFYMLASTGFFVAFYCAFS